MANATQILPVTAFASQCLPGYTRALSSVLWITVTINVDYVRFAIGLPYLSTLGIVTDLTLELLPTVAAEVNGMVAAVHVEENQLVDFGTLGWVAVAIM